MLPSLSSGGSTEPGRVIAAMERRALPWIIGSIVAFTVTGLVLMAAHRGSDPGWGR